MGKIKGLIKKITGSKKLLALTIVIVLVVLLMFRGCVANYKDRKAKQEAIERSQNATNQVETTEENADTEDAYLMAAQDELIGKYGKLPKGYIWDYDGSLLSLGDKKMSAEEVLYAYLNGIRTLDLSMAQKYSRDSAVVETYESYFDSQDKVTDYEDAFLRNMYKEVLLSIEPIELVDNAVFAENKQVFTVKLKVLDLTSKDFWEKDKYDIYNTLYMYSQDESDDTKSEMYLYDYVLNYYKSENAKTREVTVDVTLERYPDLNTGWLVSIDTDINNLCSYADGNIMVNYIQEQYYSEGINYIYEKREQESSTKAKKGGK